MDTITDRPRRSVRRRAALAAALLPWLVVLAACQREQPGLPAALGEVELREEVAGAEAAAVIDRLHGKGVTPKANRIGTYAGPQGGATLYFSAYGGEAEARRAFTTMDDRIAAGHPAFGHHQSLEMAGRPISFCLGEGQAHFYFQSGESVYWLAADAPIAIATAEALLRGLEGGGRR